MIIDNLSLLASSMFSIPFPIPALCLCLGGYDRNAITTNAKVGRIYDITQYWFGDGRDDTDIGFIEICVI